MKTITALEWELLSFFEVHPQLRDAAISWPYNDYLYEIKRGDLSLSCSIDPAYRDVRIILKHGIDKIYELNSMNVEDIKYENNDGKEYLEIVINSKEFIRLMVKPTILINHKLKNEP